jgi:hypothetical protein
LWFSTTAAPFRARVRTRTARSGSPQPIVVAFRPVGASRPVELTPARKADLLTVIDAWSARVGFDGLPAGLYEVRDALHDARRDRGGSCSRRRAASAFGCARYEMERLPWVPLAFAGEGVEQRAQPFGSAT